MKTLAISDFCRTGSGGTPSRRKSEFYDGGTIPWVKSGELKNRFVETVSEFITEEAIQNSSAKLIQPNSILLAMYGATVGEVSILPFSAASNQAVCNILPDEEVCDVDYLYWILSASKPHLLSQRVGGGQPNISQQIVKQLKIPLPPLDEQKRIAGILDAADELRTKRHQTLLELDTLIQSTFLNLFGDPVSNPKGWDVVCLGDLATRITKGQSPKWQGFNYQDNGALFVTSENVRDGYLDISSPKFVPFEFDQKLKSSSLLSGDLLINLVGASIGRSCIFKGYEGVANINQAVATVGIKDQTTAAYFLQLLQTPQGKSLLTGNIVEAARANISLKNLKELKFPLPPLELQQQFADIVERSEAQKARCQAHLDELDTLFASLQSRAFKGEL